MTKELSSIETRGNEGAIENDLFYQWLWSLTIYQMKFDTQYFLIHVRVQSYYFSFVFLQIYETLFWMSF